METTFRIPGTEGPDITVRRSGLGRIAVLAAGQPVRRMKSPGLAYEVPLADGSTKSIQIEGRWSSLKAIVDGEGIELERPLRPWERLLALAPYLLFLLGGWIGAAIGAAASVINVRILRTAAATPLRAAGAVAVSLVGAALTIGIAFAAAPVPAFTVGSCVNGLGDGQDVSTEATKPVDCASAHDGEVAGNVQYVSQGAFPGTEAIVSATTARCEGVFVSYVGLSFDDSSLGLFFVVPSESTWIKGDRTVTCIVVGPDKTKLTGSIKGSRE